MIHPPPVSLHVDAAGLVWTAAGRAAASSRRDVAEFLAAWTPPAGGELRIMGVRGNAPLIVGLHRRWPAAAVRLASPTLCEARGRVDAALVLGRLQQPEPLGRLAGCWHRLTAYDAAAYALAAGWDAGAAGPALAALAAAHPAWPALSFVAAPAALEAAVRLLVEIGDPRWFRHPYRPDRFSRLFVHLGLEPGNGRALLGQGPPRRHYDRAAAAVRVWYNEATTAAWQAGALDGPEHFLWRVFAAQRTAVRGVVKATQRLVALTVRMWECHAVGRPHAGFDAAMFFADPAERTAFLRHLAAVLA